MKLKSYQEFQVMIVPRENLVLLFLLVISIVLSNMSDKYAKKYLMLLFFLNYILYSLQVMRNNFC